MTENQHAYALQKQPASSKADHVADNIFVTPAVIIKSLRHTTQPSSPHPHGGLHADTQLKKAMFRETLE